MEHEPILPELSLVKTFAATNEVLTSSMLEAIERDSKKQDLEDLVQCIAD